MANVILTQEDTVRFWAKTKRNERTGCLEWTASRNKAGYGLFGKNRSSLLAHRVAWTLANGPVPDGMDILHHCDNPRCVEHIFVGDAAANVSDMVAKGRHHCQRVTHCPNGHEYTADNLAPRKDGYRDCRLCQRVRNAEWKRSHRR